MDSRVRTAIVEAVKQEPFARTLGIQLIELDDGRSVVEMVFDPRIANNMYARAHGGVIYGLIDEAFETAGQTDGTIAVALNVNVTYIASPQEETRLRAVANRVSLTRKTAGYDIRVVDAEGRLIATCSALAYRTGKPIPFL
ncbi:MAG: hotdog fold thioesterase [Deltaproteobacteria bacterium]|nr:hotdog fold thioesterase [Deltaproteobacteria bacterium]